MSNNNGEKDDIKKKDYAQLKAEAKRYAQEGRNSFIEMAKRLKVIRDNSLFKNDKYRSFKDFIEAELPVKRRTVYDYIDAVEQLGETVFHENPNLDYSKFYSAMPILKSDNSNIPKEVIKKELVDDIKAGKSKKTIEKTIDYYKRQYGLKKEQTEDYEEPQLFSDEIDFGGTVVVQFPDHISESIQKEVYQMIVNNKKGKATIYSMLKENEENIEDEFDASEVNHSNVIPMKQHTIQEENNKKETK